MSPRIHVIALLALVIGACSGEMSEGRDTTTPTAAVVLDSAATTTSAATVERDDGDDGDDGGDEGDEATVLAAHDLVDGFRTVNDRDANCGSGLDATMSLIDSVDGSIAWQQPIPFVYSSQEIAIRPAPDGGDLVIAASVGWESLRGGGFALELVSGDPVWQRDAEEGLTESVVGDVIAERLGSGRYRAVDAFSGAQLWEIPASRRTFGAMPIDLGTGDLYLSPGPTSNDIVAIDSRTGAERWRTRIGPEPSLFGGADSLYVVTWPSGITRLSPETGEELWSFVPGVDGVYLVDVSVSDGLILVGFQPEFESGATEFWTVLDSATGVEVSVRTSAPEPTGIMSQHSLEPRWFDGLVLTLEWDGSPTFVYTATELSTGAEQWSIGVERPAGLDAHGSLLAARRTGDGHQASAWVDLYDSSGHMWWSWETPRGLTPLATTMLDTTLIVSSGDDGFGVRPRGALTALDIATGEERWSILTDLPVARTVLETAAGLVVITSDHEIGCDG